MLQTQLNQKFSGSVNFVVSGQGTQADPYVVDVTGLANLPIGMGPPGTGAVNVTDSGASHTTASFNLWWEDIAGVNFCLLYTSRWPRGQTKYGSPFAVSPKDLSNVAAGVNKEELNKQ